MINLANGICWFVAHNRYEHWEKCSINAIDYVAMIESEYDEQRSFYVNIDLFMIDIADVAVFPTLA